MSVAHQKLKGDQKADAEPVPTPADAVLWEYLNTHVRPFVAANTFNSLTGRIEDLKRDTYNRGFFKGAERY